jgi:hypothetical protein
MFGTTRMVGRQPYAPAAFTPGEIPGTHFQMLSISRGTWFRQSHGINPQDTTGNRSGDRPTSGAGALTTTLPQAPIVLYLSEIR